ncbi:hypothetical protein OPV22_017077 [Ensete ventricosum]|uniref:Zinc-ribbon domain-containing protein n=1 Tax=Ensete ventricosum TaxID=4639 RepID=A0AAV8QRC1_ENSVE|nr:hypothetical protein OPV22_017077 [Ensete ventricosum]RZR80654.1 hypothetical protein BHM03_00006709 [Ensete ventricosum]
MASTVPPFRMVRCPRCKGLLTEFANVPVYRCGECGTTLRAKHYNATRKDIVVPPLENKSENRPDCGSLDNGLQSKNEMAVSAINDRVQSADSPNPQSSSVDASNNCYKKGDELENQEERGLESESVRLTDERDDLDHSPNEVHKSSDARQQGHENLKLSERTQVSNKSSSLEETASSSGNLSNRSDHDRHGNILRSTTRNSIANDDSVSSSDGVSNSDAPPKRIPVSRRTFRQRKVQDSEDTTSARKGEEVNKMAAVAQVHVQEVSQKPSIEKSADADRFDSNANELPTENKGHVSKDTSLDSEDFHSVQNWMESEKDGHLRSLPTDAELLKGSAKENDGHLRFLPTDAELLKGSANDRNGSPPAELNSLEHIQMEILKKVNELREEINEIFDKSDESKGRTHQEEIHAKKLDPALVRLPPKPYCHKKDVPRPHRFNDIPSVLPHLSPCLHCQTSMCRRNSGYRSCHHNTSSMTCNTLSPGVHIPCHHRPQIKHEPEKPSNEVRRQQPKRHCRPIVAGAPFVICYNCFQLLQLPINFFVARKGLNKLQCGACSKVLEFSFRARDHGIPRTVDNLTSSEVDSSADTTIRWEASNSPSDDRSQWEPISYSEDHGFSLGFSYSADAEPPAVNILRNGRHRTASQLHRLMGYGSASELLYRHSDIDEESEFTEPTPPHCNTPDETYMGDVTSGKAIYISDPSNSNRF